MYSVERDGDAWEILLESTEDEIIIEEILGVDMEIINKTFIRNREDVYKLHEKGQAWFTVFIKVKKEPGPEFHREMKKRGLTRAYETTKIRE